MVFLKLLSTIDMRLSQVEGNANNDIIVLDSLVLVIFMEDFYQFPPIIGRFLWTYLVTSEEIYNKGI